MVCTRFRVAPATSHTCEQKLTFPRSGSPPRALAQAQGLNQTLSAKGVAKIMDFSSYPWGNAYYNTSQCGQAQYDKENSMYCWIKQCGGTNPPSDCFDATKSPILCQHGPNECFANRIEGCANSLARSATDAALFTVCFEGLYTDDWMSNQDPIIAAAGQCAVKNYIDNNKLTSCFKGPGGSSVDKTDAQATARFGSSRLGTPWVVVNGYVLSDPTTQLLEAVCSNYTGTKPRGCRSTST